MSTLPPQVSLAFTRKPTADKTVFGKTVIDALNANKEKFPALPTSVDGLKKLNDDLIAKLAASASGDKTAIAQKNAAEKLWINGFKADAKYVNTVANGVEATILLAGFEVTKTERKSIEAPDPLGNFKATVLPTPGSIDIKNDGQDAAKYVYFVVPTDATFKQIGNTIEITVEGKKIYVIPDTHHHAIAEGLPSQKLGVYGIAFNSAGLGGITKTGNDVTPQ